MVDVDLTVDLLTRKMQFFCLLPRRQAYKEVCNSTILQNREWDNFQVWSQAVRKFYGEQFPYPDFSVDVERKKFNKMEKKILRSNENKAKSQTLDKLWYLFFASGEVKYLKLAKDYIDRKDAGYQLRNTAKKLFDTVKEKYSIHAKQIMKAVLEGRVDKEEYRAALEILKKINSI